MAWTESTDSGMGGAGDLTAANVAIAGVCKKSGWPASAPARRSAPSAPEAEVTYGGLARD